MYASSRRLDHHKLITSRARESIKREGERQRVGLREGKRRREREREGRRRDGDKVRSRIPCTHVIHVNWYSEGLPVASVSFENKLDPTRPMAKALKPSSFSFGCSLHFSPSFILPLSFSLSPSLSPTLGVVGNLSARILRRTSVIRPDDLTTRCCADARM